MSAQKTHQRRVDLCGLGDMKAEEMRRRAIVSVLWEITARPGKVSRLFCSAGIRLATPPLTPVACRRQLSADASSETRRV